MSDKDKSPRWINEIPKMKVVGESKQTEEELEESRKKLLKMIEDSKKKPK